MIKMFEQFNNEELFNIISEYLIDGKYLYHYTPVENFDSIEIEGLIPKKVPNSYYANGNVGIFLTNSKSLYKANLPGSLMDLMDIYYDNEDDYDTKPLIRLTIDVSKLDMNKIIWDDDYILNKYGWNKAITNNDKIKESLEIWSSICYLGAILPDLIINSDFDYYN